MTSIATFVRSTDRFAASAATRTLGSLACGIVAGLFGVVAPAAADTIDFVIDDGKVVPSEDFAVKVSVLGSAITSEGDDMPVTVEVEVGGQVFEPFGPADLALDGNVNDGGEAKHFVIQEEFNADEGITVTGTSWDLRSYRSGAYNSHYQVEYARNSQDQGAYVLVLRDGDSVPAIAAFQAQSSIADFVSPYMDPFTGRMSMDENQTIYLFELGTADLTDSRADFQDLVALVTLGSSVDELENGPVTSLAALFD